MLYPELKKRINIISLIVFLFLAVVSTASSIPNIIVKYLFTSFPREYYFAFANITNSMLFAVCYIFAIIIGSLILKNATKPKLKLHINKHPIALYFASLGVAISISHLATMLFPGSGGAGSYNALHGLSIPVVFFSTAVIPAFFEELFFRGFVLGNLLPFGKGFAIIVSSFIFGLAHGNPTQFVFATISGFVFGYLYTATGSVWLGVAVHLTNNSIAAIETIAVSNMPPETYIKIIYILEAFFTVVGIISIIYLLKQSKRESKFEDGAFGDSYEDSYIAPNQLSINQYLKSLITPFSIILVAMILLNYFCYD